MPPINKRKLAIVVGATSLVGVLIASVVFYGLLRYGSGPFDSRYYHMYEAARWGDLRSMQGLVENGADPSGIKDYRDEEAFMEFTSPLMVAVTRRDLPMVKFLLDAGADPNLIEGANWSPLMEAIEQNDIDIVKILLDCGANPKAGYGSNDSARQHAFRKGRLTLVSVIESHTKK